MDTKFAHHFKSMKLDTFLTEEGMENATKFLKRGTKNTLIEKASAFRKHLHDLFCQVVVDMGFFDYQGDLDAGIIEEIDINITPDLYNPQFKMWGDVSLCSEPKEVAYSKYQKYKILVDKGMNLLIITYNVISTEVLSFMFMKEDDGKVKDVIDRIDLDYFTAEAMSNALSLFKSARIFEESTEEHVRKEHPDLPEETLCDEAMEFFSNDNGLLEELLNLASFDTPEKEKAKYEKKVGEQLNLLARQIAIQSKIVSTSFKKSTTEGIDKAYCMAEDFVKKSHPVMERPKPSCHGLAGAILKVPKGVDTRDYVIMKFQAHLEASKSPTFLELAEAIRKNDEIIMPARREKMTLMAKELKSLREGSLEYCTLKDKLEEEQKKTKWDRESIHIKKGGILEGLMRVGKMSVFKKEVKTVPFWLDEYSISLELELRRKIKSFFKEEDCWTPHKEYKPALKEAGDTYKRFIRTRFYQELASVGELAGNILRLVTKPRKHSSLTSSWNSNMMALVGPGDGAMNEASTVPIIWFALNPDDSDLWMPTYIREGILCMSNGDRLTKARLEQMVDAPRIASVSAAILCTEFINSREDDIFYAAAVLSSVAMSINIRDSELIDHIRYMVPNIFSDRSCAEDYIVDKYAAPLKTQLQALLYKETKKTIKLSTKIAKNYYDVEIENDAIISGGVSMEIPFLGCMADSVFKLNGVVYTAFFSCKKGLHEPRSENRKMFDKICEYEYKSYKKSLIEASFNEDSYHFYDPKYISYSMYDMVNTYGSDKIWRDAFNRMENLKKPFELNTFTSLRSSMQSVHLLKEARLMGLKSKLKTNKFMLRHNKVNESWDEIWSDNRTRVIDHFYDSDRTILEEATDLLSCNKNSHFYATWDQKRQRTGRDREVFILDPNGKVFMFCVESLFKIVCDGVPHELITLPGNKKILSMNIKGTQFFKTRRDLKKSGKPYESLRMTADMTKWAPGDNVTKFIYAIASLPFLKKNEKIWYINFLCTSIRKKVVLNSLTTDVLGSLAGDGHIKEDEMWAKMLGVEAVDNYGRCKRFSKNYVDVRFNWLMGVLNDTSSAVHAASAHILKRILNIDYEIHHYQPDVHSDDAAADLIVTRKQEHTFKVGERLMDYFPKVLICSLNKACIKLSEKKTYLDRYRKEFVSEVDDNGIMKSYWQKQAIAAVSGLSYIDFFRDLSEGSSKVSNLISLGGPPTVSEVAMSNVIDLSRSTYSMQPGMWNDPKKIFPGMDLSELPLELGGPLNMKLSMLPFAGIKYQTFSKMMERVLTTANVTKIEDISEKHHDILRETEGDLFCKVWIHTTEVAVQEGLVLNRMDPGLIRFKQFSSYEKTKELRLIEDLKGLDKEFIESALEKDPTLSFRQAESLAEQQIKLAMLIKTPSWYSSATLQSQGALKLDRMYNVKSPCCAPIIDPNSPMEKGMKTIRQALKEGLQVLKQRKVDLYQTYRMLKAMPFLCYLYGVENQVKFKSSGKKILFPVQKEAFIRGSLIDSSAVGLLQKIYTGETKYFLDWHNLEKEEELVELYRQALSDMDSKQQAVALFRIFQQVQHYSSVYFVPSPRLRGHDAIVGLMGNYQSDILNHIPKNKYEPPTNEIYTGLKTKRDLNLAQKCSQFACFLYRICNTESKAKEILLNTKIDGKNALDIVIENKGCRDILYASALLQQYEDMHTPGPDEIIWLVPQKRSYPNWVGDFCAYMNVGSRRYPKGLLIFGEDDYIHQCAFSSPFKEYPNIKNKLISFCMKMNWRGGLEKHIKWERPDGSGSPLMIFSQYGSNIQSRIRKTTNVEEDIKGLRVFRTTEGITGPQFSFEELTRSGVKMTFQFRGQKSDILLMNQRIQAHFDVDCKSELGGISVKQIWNHQWFSIANNSPISIDSLIFYNKRMKVYLSDSKVAALKKMGYDVINLVPDKLGTDHILKTMEKNDLNTKILSPGRLWNAKNFSIYLSCALEFKSKLITWISLKGYIQDLAAKFQFYNLNLIDKISKSDTFKFNYETDMYFRVIKESAQRQIEITGDSEIILPRNEKEWVPAKIEKGLSWAEIFRNVDSDTESDEEASIPPFDINSLLNF